MPDGGDPFDVQAQDTGDACVQVSVGAEGKPAMLVMVIDKSTSMNESTASTGNQSKWEATRDALTQAIPNLPTTLAVGEIFYPNVSVADRTPQGCEDANSLVVAPAPMSDPNQVTALVQGVQAVPNPTTPPGTPTYDAYLLGIQLLQAAMQNPPAGFEDAAGYVMLATDGMPTHTSNCGPAFGMNDNGRLAVSNAEWQEILDLGASVAVEGIHTFVVGVPGSDARNQVPCRDASGQPTHDSNCDDSDPTQIDYVPMSKLSELAVNGATAVNGCSNDGPRYCHIDLTGTDDLVTGLQAAIGTVVQSIVSCEYRVPSDAEVQAQAGVNVFLDYDKVVVDYYTGGAATPTPLTRSNDGCATGDWQYNADQTQLTLCDAQCQAVKDDPYAAIQVNFGCVVPL